MKIDRFIVVSTCSTKFIELERKAEGVLCWASDVDRLEAINAELLEALEGMAGLFERDDWIYAGLSIKHRVIAARAAIAKAKGEQS